MGKITCFCLAFWAVLFVPALAESNTSLSKKIFLFNITKGQASSYYKDKDKWDIGLTTVFAIIAFLALPGNCLVIHVVRATPTMHSSVNWYISNMAVSDVISTLVCLPVSLQTLFSFDSWLKGKFGLFLCKFVFFFFYTSFACSSFNLAVVAIDRYLAVIKPFYRYSKRIVALFILIIWIVSTLLSLPLTFAYTNEYQPLQYDKYTICLDLERHAVYKAGVTIMTLLCYILPLTTASILYIMTGCNLRRRSKMFSESRNEKTKEMARQTAARVTALMVTVIVIFTICWAPFYVYHVVKAWYEDEVVWKLDWYYKPLCYLLASANAGINPCLYVLFSGNFRRGFKKVLCRRKKVRVVRPRIELISRRVQPSK